MNCKNCGAPLGKSMKCDYCGTNNSLTEADCKDYIVKMKFDGETREFYIAKVEVDIIHSDFGRTLDGKIVKPETITKRKLTLIEY